MLISSKNFLDIVLFFGPHLLFFVLPFAYCQSKKKFESDGKADLISRHQPSATSPTPPKDEPNSSIQAPPPAQTPPARTPVEPRSREPEDTLANVKSLAPEPSTEAPTSGKNKKKDKKKK